MKIKVKQMTDIQIIALYLIFIYGVIAAHNLIYGDVWYYKIKPFIFFTDLFMKSGIVFTVFGTVFVILRVLLNIFKVKVLVLGNILESLIPISFSAFVFSMLVFLMFEVYFTFRVLPGIYQ